MTTLPEGPTVAERLTVLERQNRRFRRLGIALLVVVGAALFMAQAAPKHRGIEERLISTQKLLLTDAAGEIKASLTVTERGPALVFFDAKGNPAISFALNQDEPKIYLNSTKRQSFASLDPNRISLNEANEQTGKTVALSIHSSGVGLSLDDGRGVRAHFMLSPSGPTLGLNDETGEKSATLSYTKEGPSLELEDTQGYSAVLGRSGLVKAITGESQQTSAASLVLFDKEKKVIWKTP
jgi:hypothetical protein